MMTTPREVEAEKYLEEHKIGEMMHNLMSMLFFYRPERPREFLIAQLEQLNASKLSGADSPCLFDDSNLDAVFGILDPVNQGFISYVQYKEALKTLGIEKFNEHPEDFGNDRISNETFKREAKEGLLRCAATFQM
ncbi:EF-hand calcium-binding domain-containing protein 10 [Brachyhypopomus gauderio]|uniref:EF-hand calcium-binding domain-containing protein 10 n=1 Tax=Brachyhypopomus gauderio TaxID=698409 RepID=UPI004041C26E